jgi:hypothetical protein
MYATNKRTFYFIYLRWNNGQKLEGRVDLSQRISSVENRSVFKRNLRDCKTKTSEVARVLLSPSILEREGRGGLTATFKIAKRKT